MTIAYAAFTLGFGVMWGLLAMVLGISPGWALFGGLFCWLPAIAAVHLLRRRR